MIRTDNEYSAAKRDVQERRERIEQQTAQFRAEGLEGDRLRRALEPLELFCRQLEEEIEEYEALKAGNIPQFEIQHIEQFGLLLIQLRIASGLTQRQLAEQLGVDESQVSRDERNEYHGITMPRLAKILDALGFDVESTARRRVEVGVS